MKNTVKDYLNQIESYFPYPKSKRQEAIENLRQDVEEALNDSEKIDPLEVFGSPLDVARNYSLNYDWSTEPAGYKIRAIAYGIDLLASLGILSITFLLGSLFLNWPYFLAVRPIVKKFGGSESWSFLLLFILPMILLYAGIWIVSFGHQTVFEHKYATTIGKKILGLTVCDLSGIRITWDQALTRNLAKMLPGVILLEILSHKVRTSSGYQREADITAGTVVIQGDSRQSFKKILLHVLVLVIIEIIGIWCCFLLISFSHQFGH